MIDSYRLLARWASRCPVDSHVVKENHFIFQMLPYKVFISAGTLAHFGCPLLSSWLKAWTVVIRECTFIYFEIIPTSFPKQQGHMLHYLSDPRANLTMFAPSILALSQLPDIERKYWTNSTERLKYLIRYLFVRRDIVIAN